MIPEQYQKSVYGVVRVLLIILCVYFGTKALHEFQSYGKMGSEGANVITLSGHGEVSAVPDIANVYFTIQKDAKTVKEAQDSVAAVEKKALDFLKENKVEDKDIQASNASFYPKYEYSYTSKSVCTQYGCPPYPGNSTIVGYTASESITVKIRNVDEVGKIMQGLGTLGVSDLSGPNFAVDKDDELKAQARKLAIEDARAKAKALAKDLHVSLGRIANFSETGYTPYLYARDAMMGKGGTMMETASEPAVPKGENTITSDVTITYEIR